MKAIFILTLAGAVTLLAIGLGLAQETPTMERDVIGSGGGPAGADGGIVLNATLGQPIVGPSRADSTLLEAGFWYGGAAVDHKIYLPVVLRYLE